MREYRTLEAAGNWKAVCAERCMHGLERGGWKRAGRLVPDTTSRVQYLAGHLLYVNARVEEERRRRMAQEDTPVVSIQDEGDQATRLARLASAAQSQGYSLDRLEQMLGIENGARKNG